MTDNESAFLRAMSDMSDAWPHLFAAGDVDKIILRLNALTALAHEVNLESCKAQDYHKGYY